MKETVESFTWNRNERVNDRYGAFCVNDPEAYRYLDGKKVKVQVTVGEPKPCEHIGDLFHGFCHTPPISGESHVLAVGTLVVEQDSIAIKPNDDRPTFWIDPMLLYRICQQEVTIEVSETSDEFSMFPFWMFMGSEQAEPQWWIDHIARVKESKKC